MLLDHRLRGLPRGQPCHLGRHKLVSQLNSRHGNYQSHSICLNTELTQNIKTLCFHFFNRLGRRPWTSKEMFVKVGTWVCTWCHTSSKWVKKAWLAKIQLLDISTLQKFIALQFPTDFFFVRVSQKSYLQNAAGATMHTCTGSTTSCQHPQQCLKIIFGSFLILTL